MPLHSTTKTMKRLVLTGCQVSNHHKIYYREKNKIMKKTILTIVTILAVSALSLTACGGEAKGSDSVSKTNNSAKTQNMNAYEFYKAAIKANDGIPYTISKKAETFLKDHSDLFPCPADKFETGNNGENVKLIDTELDAKHIMKNKDRYGDKLMMLPRLQVTQIMEGEAENADGYYSAINATDVNDGQQYFIIYNGQLDMYESDYFSCIGLPLDTSSFENTDGGTTLVVVLAGSVIDKFDDSDSQ